MEVYARLLGISVRTLYRKIQIYGLAKGFEGTDYSTEDAEKAKEGTNLIHLKELCEYKDEELLVELWKRDYEGDLVKVIRQNVSLSDIFKNKQIQL